MKEDSNLNIHLLTLPVTAVLFLELLAVNGSNVVGQVCPCSGPGPLHEQITVGAPVAAHEVVVLSWACPWWRRRKPKQPPFF